MFPVVRVRISGVDPQKQYLIALDIEPVDDMRYRYAYHRSNWLVAGKADPQPVKRYYLHPDCPYSGEQLLNQVISFEKVKLTNNEMDHNSHVSQVKIFFVMRNFHSNSKGGNMAISRSSYFS